MVGRTAATTLQRLRKGFPVICVAGPRQSGKTTLAKAACPDLPYLSLDDPDIARLAKEDPRGLLGQYRDGLILDEAQAAPEIFSYLKSAVDADPAPGKYIVTGSQQFGLLAGITESLAGRAAFLTLPPFSMEELAAARIAPAEPFEAIIKGFYPPLFDRDLSAYDWQGNYIASYVERDVRSIVNVRDLGAFRTFVRMCAARAGQLLNLSALALDCGVTHNTAKAWLSVLESSGIIFLLRPYHENFGKRLVKSPKLYFLDTGLAARLLGIKSAEELFHHPARGALFECYAVAELLKARLGRGLDPELHFWRDSAGVEVDAVFSGGPKPLAVEVKSGKTFSPEMLSSLDAWRRYSGAEPAACRLLYAGDTRAEWKGVRLVPWNEAGGVVGV